MRAMGGKAFLYSFGTPASRGSFELLIRLKVIDFMVTIGLISAIEFP